MNEEHATKCSHKAIEWKDYLESKKDGDGTFSLSEYCEECVESNRLKVE